MRPQLLRERSAQYEGRQQTRRRTVRILRKKGMASSITMEQKQAVIAETLDRGYHQASR